MFSFGLNRPRDLSVPILLFALLANALGHSFLLILMPVLGRNLGFGDVQTGLLIGLSALMLTLSGPAWGIISDRKGRKPVLFIALVSAGAFPVLLAFLLEANDRYVITGTITYGILLLLRLIQVSVTGGLMPSAQALLADRTDQQERAKGMGMMGAAFGLGSILGGMIAWQSGSSLAHESLYLIAFLIIGSAIALHLHLKEPQRGTRQEINQQRKFAYWVRLWPYLAVTVIGLTVYSILYQVIPLRLQDEFGFAADASVKKSGLIMMLTLAAMILIQGIVIRRLNWHPQTFLKVGGIIAVISMSFSAWAPSADILMSAVILLGISLGLIIPGNLAALSLTVDPDFQARAAGINTVAQGIGMAAGPILGSSLHQLSPAGPFLFAAGLFALLILLSFCQPANR